MDRCMLRAYTMHVTRQDIQRRQRVGGGERPPKTTEKGRNIPGRADQLDGQRGRSEPLGKGKTKKVNGAAVRVGGDRPFDLKLGGEEKSVVASGTIYKFTDEGSSSTSWDGVKISGLGDRIVVEDVEPGYMVHQREDLILEPDGHGGFHGKGTTGEWTLSPQSPSGFRELVLAPEDRSGTVIKQMLGVPNPTVDLARYHGARLELTEYSIEAGADEKLWATLDASGDHLSVKLDDGKVHLLDQRTPGGYEAEGGEAKVELRADDGKYEILIQTPASQFHAELDVGPKNAPEKQEFLAFVEDARGNSETHRATILPLENGGAMLRLSTTDPYRPAAIYFDKPRRRGAAVKGESRDNGTAWMTGPDVNGRRVATFKTEHGVTSKITLQPFVGEEAIKQFAGRTGTFTILAPDGKDERGDPSKELSEQKIQVTFGDAVEGSEGLNAQFDSAFFESYIHPTAFGDFTINHDHSKLWIEPQKDGTFKARAQWHFEGEMVEGTFELGGMAPKKAEQAGPFED